MNLFTRIVENECFVLQQEVRSWQDAVKLGCGLLEKRGFVTSEYYEGIIRATEEYGPYYVIAPQFAMPHARPECGGMKTGFSLVTLKHGVCFGSKDNDPVDIILTLVARTAKDMNENAIVQVMEFLESKNIFDGVRKATSKDTLIECCMAENKTEGN